MILSIGNKNIQLLAKYDDKLTFIEVQLLIHTPTSIANPTLIVPHA
ncbi:hypothetical protein DFP80_108200 [Marinomonas rhizomae]|uniref:Uncharacterized protein n=1 Tax=Marinomonas rhizomae TaxID=491948 RepID=A0A366J697_9GAMM|nr:hypothetical protein DFP80_108200 [Marinomonas rhizomae]